jgi:hypothetical protein
MALSPAANTRRTTTISCSGPVIDRERRVAVNLLAYDDRFLVIESGNYRSDYIEVAMMEPIELPAPG